jgi:sugar lactone lactonase YvrE
LTHHAGHTVRTTVVRVCRAAVAGCLALALAQWMAGQAPGGARAQGPAAGWPPGWKRYAPYPEEATFVSPRATTKLASEVRTLSSDVTDDEKFKGVVISPRILIDNPYLDPHDPFFGVPRQIACLPDGSVAVASTAKLHKEGRFAGNPYASGFWRVAPDGAITPIAAKHILLERSPYYPSCGVPFVESRITPDILPMSTAPDGSLLFPYDASILRFTPEGRVEAVPHRAESCAPDRVPSADERFVKPEAVVQDPRGNIWVSDIDACALVRVAPDGTATTVLTREQMCPAQPENWIRGAFLAWDTVRDELVMSGGLLWQKAPKANYYSMIHRVRPDGTPRRVFLGVKVGRSAPRVDGTSGLALDSKGTIYFGAGVADAGSGYQVMRLDETTGRPVLVAGAPTPTDVSLGDGPARQAYFGRFKSICFSTDDTLYVNESNLVIRKLTLAGQVTTWAF